MVVEVLNTCIHTYIHTYIYTYIQVVLMAHDKTLWEEICHSSNIVERAATCWFHIRVAAHAPASSEAVASATWGLSWQACPWHHSFMHSIMHNHVRSGTCHFCHETSKFFFPPPTPILSMERQVAVPIEPLEFYFHSILAIERELQRIEMMDEALLDLLYFLED